MYTACRCDECGTPPGLGAVTRFPAFPEHGGSSWSPQQTDAWYNRAWDWARSIFGNRIPECRGPFDNFPLRQCPGDLPPDVVQRIWINAPLPARAEMWARTVGNNPQFRCANVAQVLSDPRTGVLVQYAAAGGGDCIMSNDRAGLAPAWRNFVAQWRDGGSDVPDWISDNLLRPIGEGAAGQILPFAAAGLLIFAVTRGK